MCLGLANGYIKPEETKTTDSVNLMDGHIDQNESDYAQLKKKYFDDNEYNQKNNV